MLMVAWQDERVSLPQRFAGNSLFYLLPGYLTAWPARNISISRHLRETFRIYKNTIALSAACLMSDADSIHTSTQTALSLIPFLSYLCYSNLFTFIFIPDRNITISQQFLHFECVRFFHALKVIFALFAVTTDKSI